MKLTRCIKGAEKQANSSTTLKKTLDKIRTDAASKIKSTMSLVAAFGSNHLEKITDNIRNGDTSYTLDRSDYYNDLKLARTADEEKLYPLIEPSKKYKLIEHTVTANRLLMLKPSIATAIQRLVENPRIEKWVEEGLYLHTEEKKCQFCNNELDTKVLHELKQHFSKHLNEYRQGLAALISEITQDIIQYNPPKEVEINHLFRSKILSATAKYTDKANKYNDALTTLTEKLKAKMAAPFTEVSLGSVEPTIAAQNDFVQATEELAKLINKNNDASSDFTTLKAQAIERLKLHFAQEFIKDENLDQYDRKFYLYAQHRSRYLSMAEILNKKIEHLEHQISRALPGSNEINKKIEYLLGPNCVQITVIKSAGEERFQLRRRNGRIAKHLSEGEKTAIAFSFFLTKLGEIQNIDEAIIYIDDPISSLDSNHIFQVNSIIKETFFKLDNVKGWTTTCKQIFFSTHNFEFLSLLREIQPKFNKSNKSSNFLIRKTSPSSSIFEPMPQSMMDYPSEYHFLFEVLHDFHVAENKSDYKVLMLLPNAVRRFVELYTYAKYPAPTETSVDQRADRIFGAENSKRILKVFHFFSHANNIERLMTNSDLMCDVQGAIEDLMKLLESDATHLEALKNGLNT